MAGHARRAVAVAATMVGLTMVAATTASASDGSGRGDGRDDDRGKDHETVDLQLLTFNDFHGYLQPPTGGDATLGAALDPTNTLVGGSEYLATTLNNLRAGHRHSLTATAGDLIGGSPFLSGLFHDEPSVESLEAMHLDVSSVGNHEFDEGLTELLRMQHGGCHPVDGCYFPDQPYDGANFPWLAANVVHTDTGKTVLPSTWVKKVGDVKVGFIGMTLEGTPELVAQNGIVGLTFQDEVAAANRAVKELKRKDVKAIVVLIHEGGLNTGTFDGCAGVSGPIVQIAQNLDPAIDFIASGHTHQPYVCTIPDPKGNPRMVTSASSFSRVVTESILPIDEETGDVVRSKVTSTNHLVVRTVAPDPAETAIIAKWTAKSAPLANRVVGSVTTDIRRSPNRNTESSLGNLIADAQLEATAGAANANAQIALMNPGGVRGDITFAPDPLIPTDGPGLVTYGEAFTIQPFGNILVTVDMTGAQLKAVLEQQFVPTRSRPVLTLGISNGLTFDWDTPNVLDPTDTATGNRVSNLSLNGVAVDPAASYKVTVNNFLVDGGDGFTVFLQGQNRKGGGDDLVAFANYLGAHAPVAPPPTDRINELP